MSEVSPKNKRAFKRVGARLSSTDDSASRHTSQRNAVTKKYSYKKITAVVITLLIIVTILFIALKAFNLFTSINTRSAIWGGTPIPEEKKVFSTLLMGYGGAGHDGAYLTDTMMVIRMDIEKKNMMIISIPRDVWVRIPTEEGSDPFYRKINSVYQTGLFKNNYPAVPDKYAGEQGAGDLIKEIVGDIVGFPIDNYVALDFTGFKKAVDTLGGVDINVEKTFTDIEYPIDGMEDNLCGVDPLDLEKFEELEKIATESPELAYPCRYETLHFNAGTQHMDGSTALKFVRSRHSLEDGGDFGRARRQQLFLTAIRDRVLSLGFIPKIVPLMNDLEDNLRMDISLELLNKFLSEADNFGTYASQQVILSTDNYLKNGISDDGQYILQPTGGIDDWVLLQKDIANVIQGISPTPSVSHKISPTKSR